MEGGRSGEEGRAGEEGTTVMELKVGRTWRFAVCFDIFVIECSYGGFGKVQTGAYCGLRNCTFDGLRSELAAFTLTLYM